MADMTSTLPGLLRAVRSQLELTQQELAARLGVSFATVNRWEGGASTPQKGAMERITALAAELGVVDGDEAPTPAARRRGSADRVPSTK
ncbi:MAG TPA: helix-turn-helix transcriptional regulator, partial [Acidimicrobiales bacterium]|nr:helix-turn-helix transcriptional regulator [Acidimicrobiales bacterium]